MYSRSQFAWARCHMASVLWFSCWLFGRVWSVAEVYCRLQDVVVVVYTETLARVVRPTDSTHQPGKPIFSGRYHRRFFGARRARGRDQRAIPRQPVFIGRPTYVRPRGCWPRWSQALRIRPLQRGGTTESTTGPLHMWPSPATGSEILGPNPRPSDERPRYLPGKQGHPFDRSEIPTGTRTCARGFSRAKADVLTAKLIRLGIAASFILGLGLPTADWVSIN